MPVLAHSYAHFQAPAGPSYITGVSPGMGYFTDGRGRPVLKLGDSPKGLLTNAGRWSGSGGFGTWQQDIDGYMAARAGQGFNMVQVNPIGLPHTGGVYSNGNTWDNIAPFSTPFSVLNGTYWARMDYLLTSAASNGISVIFGIGYAYNFGVTTAGTDTTAPFYGMTGAQATALGAALGARYPAADWPNVVWYFGDDYTSGTLDTQFANMIAALASAGATQMVAIEYNTNNGSSSRTQVLDNGSAVFPVGDASASFNWGYYYWRAYSIARWMFTEEAQFGLGDLAPVVSDGMFWGELGSALPGMTTIQTNDFVYRVQSWWALASGSRGFGNGDHNVWTWQSGSAAALTGDGNWAAQAGAVRALIEGLPGWYLLVPETGTLVTAGKGSPAALGGPSEEYTGTPADSYVTAAWVPDGSLAVIYCMTAFSITIDESKMAGGYTATWVDPASCATSAATPGATYSSGGRGNNSAGQADWALVLRAP